MAKVKAEFNLMDAYEYISRLVAKRTPVQQGMEELISYCARHFPHRSWPTLAEYDFNTDVQNLQDWLITLLNDESPPPEIRVLWFGLFNPMIHGKATCGLYLSGARSFYSDQSPGAWDWKDRYWPKGRYAASGFLDLLYQVAYSDGGPQNSAEYPLALGYSSLAVAALAGSITPKIVLSGAKERALAVGFDSGDALFVGIENSGGLQAIDLAAFRKPQVPEDPDTTLYEIVEQRTGRWWIQTIRGANDEYLPGGFAQTGRREEVSETLTATIRDEGSKADWNFPVLGPPVVRSDVASLIGQLSTSCQLLSVNVIGDTDAWKIVNVATLLPWKELCKAEWSGSPWRARLNEPNIFRAGKYPGPIAVPRQIKERLELENITGLIFAPLGQSKPWRYQRPLARE